MQLNIIYKLIKLHKIRCKKVKFGLLSFKKTGEEFLQDSY